MTTEKQFVATRDKIKDTQAFLESRIDHFKTLEDRIKMIEEKCQRVQDIVLKTKSDIFSDY
jgi:hypothetical protein